MQEAADWHSKALAISEDIGDRLEMTVSYRRLGRIAQIQERLEEAEELYACSLAIDEEVGNRPGMAYSLGQLSLIAERRNNFEQALDLIVRSVALFEEFPNPYIGPAPNQLARLTHQLGLHALSACWREVTGQRLPADIHDYVHSRLSETDNAITKGDL
jgi:hypothetical protein